MDSTRVTPAVTDDDIVAFQTTVYDHYRQHGRHGLPWRQTTDPYHILVSEIMLQQTQVPRVIGKYEAFIERFPDAATLAAAEFSDVLALWQGLGYNRRALMLKRCTEEVAARFGGELPDNEAALRSLPGIGPYTASAVLAFAFDRPVVLIETNIRSAFIHHFFGDREGIEDRAILPLIELALDHDHPRKWYSALMDYGAHLKSQVANPSRRSAHHTRQSRFEGSDRQIRGAILRMLVDCGRMSMRKIIGELDADESRVRSILARMADEGLIVKDKRSYRIP